LWQAAEFAIHAAVHGIFACSVGPDLVKVGRRNDSPSFHVGRLSLARQLLLIIGLLLNFLSAYPQPRLALIGTGQAFRARRFTNTTPIMQCPLRLMCELDMRHVANQPFRNSLLMLLEMKQNVPEP